MRNPYLWTTVIYLMFMTNFTSCQYLQRHPESGYSSQSDITKSGWKKVDLSQIIEKFDDDVTIVSDEVRLKTLENKLTTRREVEQYSKILPFLKNEQERIEFIEQGSLEERQQWLRENGIFDRAQANNEILNSVAESQDIALGMTEKHVVRAWGEPDEVDVSGSTRYKNHRWKYKRQIATSDGYFPEKRVIYFEGGRVIGWEKD